MNEQIHKLAIELKRLDRELGIFDDNVKTKLAAYQRAHLTEIRDALMKVYVTLLDLNKK